MLELNHWNTFQVHYSLSYATPLLLARFSLPSGEPLPLRRVSFLLKVWSTMWTSHAISFWFLVFFFKVWSSIVPPEAGAWDRVSPSPHPLTGLPWIQVSSHLKKKTFHTELSIVLPEGAPLQDCRYSKSDALVRASFQLPPCLRQSLWPSAWSQRQHGIRKNKMKFCSSPFFSLLPVSMPKRPSTWSASLRIQINCWGWCIFRYP